MIILLLSLMLFDSVLVLVFNIKLRLLIRKIYRLACDVSKHYFIRAHVEKVALAYYEGGQLAFLNSTYQVVDTQYSCGIGSNGCQSLLLCETVSHCFTCIKGQVPALHRLHVSFELKTKKNAVFLQEI